MSKKITKSLFSITALAIFICLLYFLSASLVSVHRYFQYEVNYYDFGIYAQAVYEISQFKPPIIDHFVMANKWIFADHFQLLVFFLAPLYWLGFHNEFLLIAQALSVALSGLVIFLLAKNQIKSQLIALAVLMQYLLFVGLQNALIFDIHPVTFLTLPLSWYYYALFKNKQAWLFPLFVLGLTFKESLFLLGVGLAIFTWFRLKNKTLLILELLYSFFWLWLCLNLVIPYFSGGVYQYSSELPPALWPKMLALFWPIIKIKTVLLSLLSFSGLPLLAWPAWPVFGLHFLMRFLSPGSTRWDLGLHYSAELAPSLAVGSILVLAKLKRQLRSKERRWLLFVLMIMSTLFLHFKLHGPLQLSLNPDFYRHSSDFGFLDRLVSQVPARAPVMTQNNLAVRFIDRRVYLFRLDYEKYAPEYLVFDLRPGQNPNNFLSPDNIFEIFEKVKSDPNYDLIYQTQEQFVFERVK